MLWIKKIKIHLVVFLPLQKISPLIKCGRKVSVQDYFSNSRSKGESNVDFGFAIPEE